MLPCYPVFILNCFVVGIKAALVCDVVCDVTPFVSPLAPDCYPFSSIARQKDETPWGRAFQGNSS